MVVFLTIYFTVGAGLALRGGVRKPLWVALCVFGWPFVIALLFYEIGRGGWD